MSKWGRSAQTLRQGLEEVREHAGLVGAPGATAREDERDARHGTSAHRSGWFMAEGGGSRTSYISAGLRPGPRYGPVPCVALRSLLATSLLVASTAWSQTITRGPLLQNPDALPTTATFVWWTNVAGNSVVEYGLTPALGQSVTVPQAGSCEVGSAGTCHTVKLTGLSPETLYYYRLLTNGVEVAPVTYFTTLAAPGVDTDHFFTVIGDWGQGTTPEAQLAALQNAADPPMILTVGDNTYTFGFQSELDSNALAYYTAVLPRTMFFPALGNHDLNVVFGNVNSYGTTPLCEDVRTAAQRPGPARALLLLRLGRRALHADRHRQLLRRDADDLAPERSRQQHGSMEVRVPAPRALLVRERGRVVRQQPVACATPGGRCSSSTASTSSSSATTTSTSAACPSTTISSAGRVAPTVSAHSTS